MYQDTITLFNYHAATDSWYTTVFTGTNLVENTASNATRQGHTSGDAVELIVHTSKSKQASGKQYIRPKIYAATEDPSEYFTFVPESDFFIAGEHGSDTPINDSDFEDGLYSAMNDMHDGVYMISSAAFYSLLPHFEIGGR